MDRFYCIYITLMALMGRFSESKGVLPLKTMFRYGLLEYCNHFNCFLGSVGDFEDDV